MNILFVVFLMKVNVFLLMGIFLYARYNFLYVLYITQHRATSPAVHVTYHSVTKGKKNCTEKEFQWKEQTKHVTGRVPTASDAAVRCEQGGRPDLAVCLPWANMLCTRFHPLKPFQLKPGHCPAGATF